MKTVLAAIVTAALLCSASHAGAVVVYNALPPASAKNTDSLVYGFAAASEFGDAVTLAGTARYLTAVTISLSGGAVASNYAGTGTAAGYDVPMTLRLYALGSGGANPTVGTVLTSRSVVATIPWRPPASAGCTNGDYQASDGYCYSGIAARVTFDVSGLLAPDSLIAGLSFDPSSGPASELGFGFFATSVGTDINTDGVEWNTADASYRTIGAANTFGPDTGWSDYGTPAIRIEASTTPVPEPGTALLLAPLLGAVLLPLRRRT